MVFPNIRIGRDYPTNWELNKYRVIPSEEAYRNLHTRGLQMLCKDVTVDKKSGRMDFKTEEPKEHNIYYASSNLENNQNTVGEEAWKSCIRQVNIYSKISFYNSIKN